jgi:hypothetical protein
MKTILFIIVLFSSRILFSQIGMGKWRIHASSSKAIDIAVSDQFVYTAFEKGILKVDLLNNFENTVMDVMNGLSDVEISCIYWDKIDNSLFIGYENGNIDKVKNDIVFNIPAIKLANVASSKRVNRFERIGNYIFVATDFALIELNPAKNEVRETYYPTNGNEKILDIANIGDTIFALSPSRLLRGVSSNPILSDPSQWQVDSRISVLNEYQYKEVEVADNKLFIVFKHDEYGKDSLFYLSNSGKVLVSNNEFPLAINSISKLDENQIAMNCQEFIIVYNTINSDVVKSYKSINIGASMSISRSFKSGDGLWAADRSNCLYLFPTEFSFKNFRANGPYNNFFYSMDYANGKMGFASGYMMATSPAFSKNGIHFFENETWSFVDNYQQPCWNGKYIWDFLDISINPLNHQEYAVCTPSEIPVTVFNPTCNNYIDSNSTLELMSEESSWYWISDVCYDDDGNLWCLNGFTDNPLNVLDKNKNWKNFYCGFEARNKRTQKMIIDFNNLIWFSVKDQGLFGYNHNGTIEDESDDQFKQITSGAFTGDLPSSNVTAIAADFNGEIWIGTDAGFAILYNATNVFAANSGDYNAQRIKINFEGNVEYLLGSTHITDIEVDGGNRKWMATANSGLILLSADGNEILETLTMENSPLISNVIYDIKLNQETGELFIITDRGLVSYRTDASYEDPNYESTIVFPNPVRPNFFGPVTIQGIRYDSDVKITDVAGNLVFKTTSNGGTATWDCKTLNGQKVASGVYFIWTATNEGKDKKVGKVLVIN